MLARFSQRMAVPPLDILERVHRQYVATGITSVINGAQRRGYRRTSLQRAGRLNVRPTVTFRIRIPKTRPRSSSSSRLPFRFAAVMTAEVVRSNLCRRWDSIGTVLAIVATIRSASNRDRDLYHR